MVQSHMDAPGEDRCDPPTPGWNRTDFAPTDTGARDEDERLSKFRRTWSVHRHPLRWQRDEHCAIQHRHPGILGGRLAECFCQS